ncbi:response regulator transcription factor [Corynebacterium genitalium ATCC 33030]|uniref:Response regulator receiver domain protein n=1 Tax=Corynebacterium genitalium ATCC 33030 TaxID=585529 RepID=D7WB23_9CORY|nr:MULTISPECIES: response regulator transcription factor [Corynebacterium]MCQ4617580.1 response regulator transcription factor [Corynebacterium pseudogenitalium]EFK55054.1 response regulator receiver domain protein [Corynebacterium genitalium ATCC 33030]MCQ4620623.1 response regulator transcription factor [Corynebacterium sp. CCUG 71335]MCQ4626352.1 response regulator transcription factor [Corynebacterium sp. CCUG 65737]UUA89673.1 response regulator transcription factor [Corynebacterium genita
MRLLLADDQPLLLSALATILNSQPDIDVVCTATNGQEAVDAVDRVQQAGAGGIDIAVLDIRMPVMDGITAAKKIMPLGPKVIMLTTFNDDELVQAAITAGVHGFLLKDADPDVLADAVRAVDRGESVLASGVTGAVLEWVRGGVDKRNALSDYERQALSMLTAREVEVLAEIAAGATNAEISQRLFIAPTTVKTHVKNLLVKLGARDRVALVLLAHRAGISS